MRLIIFFIMTIILRTNTKNKMILDYECCYTLEEKKIIHNKLDDFYKRSGIYILIVTTKDKNYKIEKSILDAEKSLKNMGFDKTIIIIKRAKNYNIVPNGFTNLKIFKKELSKINLIYNSHLEEINSILLNIFNNSRYLKKVSNIDLFFEILLSFKYYIIILLVYIIYHLIYSFVCKIRYLKKIGVK